MAGAIAFQYLFGGKPSRRRDGRQSRALRQDEVILPRVFREDAKIAKGADGGLVAGRPGSVMDLRKAGSREGFPVGRGVTDGRFLGSWPP
jgi:hypothetical protein